MARDLRRLHNLTRDRLGSRRKGVGITLASRWSVWLGAAATLFSAPAWGASALTAGERAAVASAGAQQPQVLVRGKLTVLLASDASGKASAYAVLPATTVRGAPTALRLGYADEPNAIVTAVPPAEFLGQHDLMDVVISFTAKTPALTSWHEKHYLVRTTGTGTVACEFPGDGGSSSQDSEFAERVMFAKTSLRPLGFSATSVGAGHQGATFFDGVPQKKTYAFTRDGGARCELVTAPGGPR
jgi:hypothetical protein